MDSIVTRALRVLMVGDSGPELVECHGGGVEGEADGGGVEGE